MDNRVSKEEILQLVKELYPLIDWENETRLISERVLDSLSIVNLVSELSVEYDIEFDLDAMSPESMDTLEAITATVNKLIEEKN